MAPLLFHNGPCLVKRWVCWIEAAATCQQLHAGAGVTLQNEHTHTAWQVKSHGRETNYSPTHLTTSSTALCRTEHVCMLLRNDCHTGCIYSYKRLLLQTAQLYTTNTALQRGAAQSVSFPLTCWRSHIAHARCEYRLRGLACSARLNRYRTALASPSRASVIAQACHKAHELRPSTNLQQQQQQLQQRDTSMHVPKLQPLQGTAGTGHPVIMYIPTPGGETPLHGDMHRWQVTLGPAHGTTCCLAALPSEPHESGLHLLTVCPPGTMHVLH